MSAKSFTSTDRVASDLVRTLSSADGLNDFLERTVPTLATLFGAQLAVVIDYHEAVDRFELLYFQGFHSQARFEIQRSLDWEEIRLACSHKAPYVSGKDPRRLYVPLYFSETLEAVLVFEAGDNLELTEERVDLARIVAKFLGLLMSSSRLKVNRVMAVDSNDLQRARQIQLTYLPNESLQTDRYEIYGYNRSSALVGGDYFDYFRTRANSIQCVLADACGHGLSAALIMSMFRGLVHAEIGEFSNCGELFSALNRSLHLRSGVVQYLTGVFLDFDDENDRLQYTNAGHFDPIIVRREGNLERLSGGGPPLGMFRTSEYPMAETQVRPGDLLLLFTDGLPDLQNQRGEFFGEERILPFIERNRSHPLKQIASTLLEEGLSFSAPSQPADDLTLFMMRFR